MEGLYGFDIVEGHLSLAMVSKDEDLFGNMTYFSDIFDSIFVRISLISTRTSLDSVVCAGC